MLDRLERKRWVAEKYFSKYATFGTGSWYLTDMGRKVLKPKHGFQLPGV